MAKHIPAHRFDRWVQESADFQTPHREKADKAWRYINSEQWTTEEKDDLDLVNQAPAVINILFPLVNAIAAVEINRRTDYTVVPNKESTESLSVVLTHVLNQIYKENSFKFLLGKGFYKGLISGISWIEVAVETDLDTDLDHITLSNPPFEDFYYDPFASRYDLTDARFISREIWMDFEEAEELFGEDIAQELRTFFDETNSEFRGQEQAAQSSAYSYVDRKRGRVAVHSMYYRNHEGRVHHLIFSGTVFIKGSERDADNPSPWKYNYIPYVPYIVSFDKEGRPQGIVDPAIPIQDIINKAQSKQQFLMATRRCIFETGTFVDPDLAKMEWAKPNGWIEVLEGGLNKIKEEQTVTESQNLMAWIQVMIQIAQRIMGVNEALIGAGGPNARSAIQEQGRISQGEGMQAPSLESLYFTKLAVTKVVFKMMAQFYTEERVVRIAGPNNTFKFTRINSTIEDDAGRILPFNKMPEHLHFDFNVKEEAPFTNARELNARTLSEIMKAVPLTTPALIAPTINSLSGIEDKENIINEVRNTLTPQQQETLPTQ